MNEFFNSGLIENLEILKIKFLDLSNVEVK
jgi:hypothetical protein